MPDAELEKAAQDAREIEAQKAAGRYTGIGILDELDRRVQNYGQLPGKGGRSLTAGYSLDTQFGASGPNQREQDGQAEEGIFPESERKLKDDSSSQAEDQKRRATRGRTVITSLNTFKPKLSRRETLGQPGTLG
jgi:hypothetical protein